MTVSDDLRGRLGRQAERRELKLATVARVLIVERLDELEEDEDLRRAEEWQRKQALATWERIAAGDVREVSIEQIREDTRKALARASAKRRR